MMRKGHEWNMSNFVSLPTPVCASVKESCNNSEQMFLNHALFITVAEYLKMSIIANEFDASHNAAMPDAAMPDAALPDAALPDVAPLEGDVARPNEKKMLNDVLQSKKAGVVQFEDIFWKGVEEAKAQMVEVMDCASEVGSEVGDYDGLEIFIKPVDVFEGKYPLYVQRYCDSLNTKFLGIANELMDKNKKLESKLALSKDKHKLLLDKHRREIEVKNNNIKEMKAALEKALEQFEQHKNSNNGDLVEMMKLEGNVNAYTALINEEEKSIGESNENHEKAIKELNETIAVITKVKF